MDLKPSNVVLDRHEISFFLGHMPFARSLHHCEDLEFLTSKG